MRPPFDHLSYLYHLIELYHLYYLMSTGTEKAGFTGIMTSRKSGFFFFADNT